MSQRLLQKIKKMGIELCATDDGALVWSAPTLPSPETLELLRLNKLSLMQALLRRREQEIEEQLHEDPEFESWWGSLLEAFEPGGVIFIESKERAEVLHEMLKGRLPDVEVYLEDTGAETFALILGPLRGHPTWDLSQRWEAIRLARMQSAITLSRKGRP
jgi:hypothetical protein